MKTCVVIEGALKVHNAKVRDGNLEAHNAKVHNGRRSWNNGEMVPRTKCGLLVYVDCKSTWTAIS